jgi:hypothetical protein
MDPYFSHETINDLIGKSPRNPRHNLSADRHAMRLTCMSTLLSAGVAYQPTALRMLPHATRQLTVLTMGAANNGPQRPTNGVKVTIRKRSGGEAPAANDAYPAFQEDSPIFVAKFSHVKRSLSTFLKFWLMGGCGVDGWAGTGELDAEHSPSGTTASILVDAEQATVSLISSSAPSVDSTEQLNEYAAALLDELDSLAKTDEAAAADRLCYPPDAVGPARLAAWAALAPREPSVNEEATDDDETDFQKFLKSLKK